MVVCDVVLQLGLSTVEILVRVHYTQASEANLAPKGIGSVHA